MNYAISGIVTSRVRTLKLIKFLQDCLSISMAIHPMVVDYFPTSNVKIQYNDMSDTSVWLTDVFSNSSSVAKPKIGQINGLYTVFVNDKVNEIKQNENEMIHFTALLTRTLKRIHC